jgi:hypothetical protein
MLISLNDVLSDIPFLFFSTLSMLLIDRAAWGQRERVFTLVEGLLLGFSLFCAYFIRPAGILLLPPLLIVQISRYLDAHRPEGESFKRNLFYGFLPYALFFTILLLSSLSLYANPSSNWELFNRSTALLALKHCYRYAILPALIIYDTSFQSIAHHVIAIVTIPLALVGILKNWRKDYHFIVYSALTLGLYVIWPFYQGLRFMFPILPFYVYFVLRGLEGLLGMIFHGRRKLARQLEAVLISGVLLIASGRSLLLGWENVRNDRQQSGPYDPISQEVFSFVHANTRQEDVVVFEKPRVMRMLTGRNSYRAKSCADLDQADYVLLSKGEFGSKVLFDCVEELPMQATFENQGFVFYRLSRR